MNTSTTGKRNATPEETKAILDDLLNNGIIPHAEQIARIGLDGDVAIVLHDPCLDDAQMRTFVEMLRGSENGKVVRLTRTRAQRLFGGADALTRKWMTTRAPDGGIRILLVSQLANYLVNYTPGKGYSFEPGSLDTEYLS